MNDFVTVLTPTFNRPKLLANAVAQFIEQDYPADQCQMLILDDAGQYMQGMPEILEYRLDTEGHQVVIRSTDKRYASLPDKFNSLWMDIACSHTGIFMVFEDDDLYLKSAISNTVKALQHGDYSHPTKVKSTYPGYVVEEGAAGRFHASIGFRRELIEKIGGWPQTKRADFDQQLMSRLAENCTKQVDPCDYGPPQYVFRWGSSGSWHGQSQMRSPDDVTWYDRIPIEPVEKIDRLIPKMDLETESIYSQFGAL